MRAAVVKNALYRGALVSLSLTVGLATLNIPIALAGPGDLNSINDGQDIQSGTYFNTPGSRTTFQNSSGSGLWLHSSDLVRGLESNASSVPTGNGGTLYFRAPGNVVRFDGNIDVSAVRNGALYTGNGGKVFVDSAYLFQNGSIFANGVNGGLVQFNVGGMTAGPNAKITAQGFGGNGGSVNINATGTVDFQLGSLIDTSGKVAGTFDTNIINIEGSAINNQGILRANGIASSDFKPDNGDAVVMAANPDLANNPVPGPITGGSGTNDTATMQNVLFGTPSSADFRGGTIRLVATGQTNPTTTVISNADSQILSDTEKSSINTRNSQIVSFNEGDVFNRGTLETNGAFNKDGGTVIIGAARHVVNSGAIRANGGTSIDGVFDPNGNGANGGNGGAIILTAMNQVNNTNLIQANGGAGSLAQSRSGSTGTGQNINLVSTPIAGNGGRGGVIAVSYNTGSNTGSMQANGGVGGGGSHANSFDIEIGNAANPTPTANASATANSGGNGGQGGLIAFSGNANFIGGGGTFANGGQGGRGGNGWADAQSFSNFGLPIANASATAGAGGAGGSAGAILAPDPGTFGTGQNFSAKAGGSGTSGVSAFRRITVQNGVNTTVTGGTAAVPGSLTTGSDTPIFATRKNEYIRHAENGILLTQNGGDGNVRDTLTGRIADTLIRTVTNPAGTAGDTLSNMQSAGNLIIASSAPLALTNNIVNSNINPLFFNLNTLTILNNGDLTNGTLWTPGVHLTGEGFHDMEFSVGGGHISWLSNGTITNNQIVMTRGLWSGGSITLASTLDIVNNSDFINISLNKALLSGFTVAGPAYESSHAGSLIMKAAQDINNTSSGKLETNLIFYDIHPPLSQNPPIDWPKFLNGAQMGATVNLLAGRNLSNAGIIGADALTYRNGQLGADNPALTIGGIVIGRARTGTFTNTGTITANGDAFFSPNESDGPRFNTNIFSPTTSFAGTLDTP